MPWDFDPNTVCDASRADVCYCDAAATRIGAIVRATAAEDRESSLIVRVDAIHGSPGGIVVGQSLTLPSYTRPHVQIGDSLLVSVLPNPARPDHHTINAAFRIDQDVVVVDGCDTPMPALRTTAAIEAALAPNCSAHLATEDAAWGESHCDDGGCSIQAGGSGMAAIAIVAALCATRPARRRYAKRTL